MIKNILISLAILISFDAFSRDYGKYYGCEFGVFKGIKDCHSLKKGDILHIKHDRTAVLLYCDQDELMLNDTSKLGEETYCFYNGKAIKDFDLHFPAS